MGVSSWSLHMNGSTEAAAAAAASAAKLVVAAAAAVLDVVDVLLNIMIATAAAVAAAPFDRNTARATGDACITLRAHVSICSCSAAAADGSSANKRKISPDAKAGALLVGGRDGSLSAAATTQALEMSVMMSGVAVGGRRGTRSRRR